MKKQTGTLKKIVIIILVAFITYFGGGSEYIDDGISFIGNKIADKLSTYFNILPSENDDDTIEGTIVHVSDGDTVILKDSKGKTHKIRLNGIDCPEVGQEYGEEATDFVKARCLKKHATVVVIGVDQYDRILGVLYVGELNINEELLRNGLAWRYQFSNDREYKKLVNQAKEEELNIWSQYEPMNPYIYRKKNARR